MRAGPTRWSSGAFALTVLVAACAPSTFDNLTGAGADEKPLTGLHENDPNKVDESLKDKDPRPVAPFSTSWVNTAKPHLKWVLQAGTAGATVELSQARDFTGATTKRYVATGSELSVPDELPPGVWFWRLQARTATNPGVSWGPTWEVLVRGPSKSGKSSDAAHGGITDVNGDGIADFTISLAATDPTQKDPKYVNVNYAVTLFGVAQGDKPIGYDPFGEQTAGGEVLGTADAGLASGFDLDGDGYGDVAVADVWQPDPPMYPNIDGQMYALFGGPPSTSAGPGFPADPKKRNDTVISQPFTVAPIIGVGDFNGDGFGDVSAIFPQIAMTIQGSADGTRTLLPFESAAGTTPPASFVMSAGDYDGDGIADVAYTPYDTLLPIKIARGGATRLAPTPNVSVGNGVAALPTRASAMTTGDFDGDGMDEVAFTTLLGGKPAICVYSPTNAVLTSHGCWVSDGAADGFGKTLGTGDFDGDGVDDIMIASTAGYTLLTHAGTGYTGDDSVFTPKVVSAPALGTSFTVLHPGRPGKAQWAAYAKEGKSLIVLRGVDTADIVTQTFDFSKLVSSPIGLDFIRFGTGIR